MTDLDSIPDDKLNAMIAAHPDNPDNLSKLSDADLDKAIATHPDNPRNLDPNLPQEGEGFWHYQGRGLLNDAKAVASYPARVGESLKSGLSNADAFFRNLGLKNITSDAPSPVGPATTKFGQDWAATDKSDISNWPKLANEGLGAFNEGFASNPGGQALGAVGGILGAPVAPFVQGAVDQLDKSGLVPKEVSQAALNLSPALSFMKGKGTAKMNLPSPNPEAQAAMASGMPLAKSQVTNSPFMRTMASTMNEIPGSGGPEFQAKQQQWLNSEAARSIGQSGDKITPDIIDKAHDDIGAKYDAALQGKVVPMTGETITRLGDIEDQTKDLAPDHRQIVLRHIDTLLNEAAANGGNIKGETLGNIRSQLSKAAKVAPPGANMLLGQLRDVVMGMPGDEVGQQIADANRQYRNLKTIEPIATSGDGDISPARLKSAVMRNFKFGEDSFQRGGGGELGDLARKSQFMKEGIPNSGTARRSLAYTALLDLGGGAVGSLMTGSPLPFLASAGTLGGGIGAARMFNKFNTNQAGVKNYLAGGPSDFFSALQMGPAKLAGMSVNKTQQDERKNGK